MAEITSVMKSIKGILDNKNQFSIPDFQRSFVWTANDIDILFADFNEDTADYSEELESLPGYLLGNIVLISSNEKTTVFDVIDGQQRLTTLTLIFCALNQKFYDIAYTFRRSTEINSRQKEQKWTNHAVSCNKYFHILNSDFEFEDYKILHKQNLDFKETYKSIIKQGNQSPTEDSDSANNIDEVYDAIKRNIDAIYNKNPEKLLYFLEYLSTKVKLIETRAPSIERAFQLFEILNNRGQSLEPLDLLKNHLLKDLSNDSNQNQINEFSENWIRFLQHLKDNGRKNPIETSTFVKHFIMGLDAENIKKRDLFSYFKDKAFKTTDILKLAEDLKSVSKVYASIEKNPLNNDFLVNDDGMFTIFTLFNVSQIHPLLMPFYDFERTQKVELVDAAVRYVAAVLFSFTQTNSIESELPDIIKLIHEAPNRNDKLSIAIKELEIKTKPYVDLIKPLLPVKDFGSKNKKKAPKAFQLLKFIELYLNGRDSIKTDKKIQLEHIMPQSAKLENYSFESEESRREYLNRLGNLTLLDKRLNNSANNESFANKLEHYKASEFVLTKALANKIESPIHSDHKLINFQNKYFNVEEPSQIEYWDKQQIDERSAKLVEVLGKLLLRQDLP